MQRCTLKPGDTLLLKNQLLLLCARRPLEMRGLRDFPASAVGPFGEPDALGIVGESPAVWRLRDRIAWNAKAGRHVLILGESGTGKELAARALHTLSPLAGRRFVARNAATIPAGLVDAELFGNVKGYPNAGMPERPGLVGEADGGTLFLDEIGELPQSLHANLLRVLDGGEYHRLGGSSARRADIRLIAATNRDPGALKHDLAGAPDAAVHHAEPRRPARGHPAPRPAPAPRRALPEPGGHPPLHGRERRAARDARGARAGRGPAPPPARHPRARARRGALAGHVGQPRRHHPQPPDSVHAVAPAPSSAAPVSDDYGDDEPATPYEEPDPDRIRACLAEHGGNVSRAARALELPNRYVLYRLLRKHGIEVDAARGRSDGR